MTDETREALASWFRHQGGSMTVARFMEGALHHPEFGYYRRAAADVGPRGDFSTAATLHPALAQAIARWSVSRRETLAGGTRWHLLEIGGGGGQLAHALLRALGLGGRRGLSYHLVESSPALETAQRRRLRRFRRVRWHRSMTDALGAAGGDALIVSNELVDAFPCHQVIRLDGRWREVWLRLVRGAVLESAGAISDPRILDCSLPAGDRAPREGRRYEIHLAYRDWLHGWRADWRRGAMLTIDYGDVAAELARRGPGGSLRAFFRHLRITGASVYRRFGRQDLTADVNFTDLVAWGEEAGLTTVALTDQREFLLEHGPGRPRRAGDEALDYLTAQAGAGSAYRVLEQRSNMPVASV